MLPEIATRLIPTTFATAPAACGTVRQEGHDWHPHHRNLYTHVECARCHSSQYGHQAARPLIELFDSSDAGVASAAVKAMAQMGESVVEPLIQALHGSNNSRLFATEALVQIGDPACRKLVHTLVDHKEAPEGVALSLQRIGRGATPALIGGLSVSWKHDKLARVLVAIGAPAVEELIAALSDFPAETYKKSEATTRIAGVVKALGEIADPRAFDPIINALNHPAGHDVRVEAVKALAKFGGARACDALIGTLAKTFDFKYRVEVASALMTLGYPKAEQLLVEQLKRPDADGFEASKALRRLAEIRAVEPLIEFLQHDKHAREAADLLGTLGDVRACEPLAAALPKTSTRVIAAKSLVRLGDFRGVEPLLTNEPLQLLEWFLTHHGKLILEYGAHGRDRLVPFLMETWKSSGSRRAAALLVHLNEPSMTPHIPALLLDWLMVRERRVERGLEFMAARAGMDSETLALAASALGNTYEIDHGNSGGGNYSWEALGAHNMQSIIRLCQRPGIWSSCILYRVARKKDVVITLSGCMNSFEVKLDFQKERQAAEAELIKRGFHETDPITKL